MWIVGMVLIVFCLKGTSVGQCDGQVWKKIDVSNGHLAGWFSGWNVQSIKECGERCSGDSQCRSFGVDIINWKCYLYKYLVWSGGQVLDNEPPLMYYWEHQKVCPASYTYEESINFCYKFSTDKKEWVEALKICQKDNGLLVMADTSLKKDFIRRFVENSGNRNKIYVGTTDKNAESIWKWMNGAPVTDWSPNEPNNYLQLQHCGVLVNGEKIDDEYCNGDKEYICEVPMV